MSDEQLYRDATTEEINDATERHGAATIRWLMPVETLAHFTIERHWLTETFGSIKCEGGLINGYTILAPTKNFKYAIVEIPQGGDVE